ncbi:HAMP domain-containing histidine kinase [Bradyrhizobium sp. ARR65]|uniref:HAMP domain-containing histidine kinase n=1 Tax=Bradyrhizobium sp. ARR65 TaxID=1040989 RepID=UPI0004633BCD|nr:HAMP domain-containing histidine kinase [Bradyrhizobium sp. ARR65]
MTALSQLNNIAVRIGIAIVFAIFLVVLTLIGLSQLLEYYGYGQGDEDGRVRSHLIVNKSSFGIVNPRRNPMMLSGRIAVIIRSVASAPSSEQQRIVAAVADPEIQVALDAAVAPVPAGHADDYTDRLRRLIQMQLDMASPPISVSARSLPASVDGYTGHSNSTPKGRAVVEAVLQDGRRITFTIPYDLLGNPNGLILVLISIVIVSGLVSVWTARRLAAPIKEFARAAERLGVDLTMQPLAERGPRELRVTIQALNRMQHRLQRFLEDRTQMLAAISHDLRAPLARLRLRAELVADSEQQRKMFDDLEAMNAMIESTLTFVRDDTRQEPRKLVDLGVLVGDLCEDFADAGGEVSYTGRRGIDVSCRPALVRRAVANLIDNAVKYGGGARVGIVHDHDRVVIAVDDDGPGIPPEEYEKVFAPFYRREPARDPTNAGVGLGLSIARTVAREHGGDVTLKSRDSGGLSALIELPA